jgi:hypothetical protein
MSPIEGSAQQASEPWRLILAAVHCLAAFSIVLTCFASPGHRLPTLSVALACGAAIGLGILCLSAFHDPTRAFFLPLIIILSGAAIGVVSLNKEAQNDWLILLGNLQAVAPSEAWLRFFIAFAALGTLAAFCNLRRVARGLALFALSGPGLLLLYLGRSRLERWWPDFSSLTVNAVSLGGFLVALLMWEMFLRKSLILESLQDAIGRQSIRRVLNWESPQAISRALEFIDGHLDPLKEMTGRVADLLQAGGTGARQQALSKAIETLNAQGYVLPPECRKQLEAATAVKPEALVVLAVDDDLRRQLESSINRLEVLASALLLDSQLSWIAQTAQQTWATRAASSPRLTSALQNITVASQIAVFVNATSDQAKALEQVVTALRHWATPLPEPFRRQLANLVNQKPEVFILLAEDDFRSNRAVAGFLCLGRLLKEVTPAAVWLGDITLAAWERHRTSADAPLQRALWQTADSRTGDGPSAFAALAMIALQQGLAPELVDLIKGRPVRR